MILLNAQTRSLVTRYCPVYWTCQSFLFSLNDEIYRKPFKLNYIKRFAQQAQKYRRGNRLTMPLRCKFLFKFFSM